VLFFNLKHSKIKTNTKSKEQNNILKTTFNKCILINFLKCSKVEAFLILMGSAFHNLGAVNEKALSPMVLSLLES